MRAGEQGAALHRRVVHRPALDGLRGVAVLVIVVYHSTALAKGSVEVSRRFGGAFLGVDMFFVLSGFLITALLVQEQEQSGRVHLGRFFGRRALRLLPALYLLLLVHGLYVWLTGLAVRPEMTNLLGAGLYYKNWIGAFHPDAASFFPPPGAAGLVHLWSLSLEMQFYVVWPFVTIAALTVTRRTSTAVVTLVVLLIVIVAYRWILFDRGVLLASLYSRTDTRSDALVIGALLAVIWLRVDGAAEDRESGTRARRGRRRGALHRQGAIDGPLPVEGRAHDLRDCRSLAAVVAAGERRTGHARVPVVAPRRARRGLVRRVPVAPTGLRRRRPVRRVMACRRTRRGRRARDGTLHPWVVAAVERPLLGRRSTLRAPGTGSSAPRTDDARGQADGDRPRAHPPLAPETSA